MLTVACDTCKLTRVCEVIVELYRILGCPDICCHTTVLDRRQYILSFALLRAYIAGSTVLVK